MSSYTYSRILLTLKFEKKSNVMEMLAISFDIFETYNNELIIIVFFNTKHLSNVILQSSIPTLKI